MSVVALGLDYRVAPLDLRGRFSFPVDTLAPRLRAFRERVSQATEVAIVSTCNRTELFVGSADDATARVADDALNWLAEAGRVDREHLQGHCYVLESDRAARHAFRLASGLSSMVVGETQILGQMKQAVREAGNAGTLGVTLNQLFQRSFAVAKEVRTDTDIGRHTVSLSAAIVQLAGNLFEDFADLRVLVLGAGEMAERQAMHLSARRPKRVTIANRHVERGQALALRCGAEAIGLTEAMARLAEFDVVVTCTASPEPLIGRDAVSRAIKTRRHRPMLLVDLAVPRDIEPEVGTLTDVYHYSIDDLTSIVQAGSDKRVGAIDKAETIIESGVQDFLRWMGNRETVPLIQALQTQTDTWRNAEMQRARKAIARGDDIEAVLESMSRGLVQKVMHGPVAGLHHSVGVERDALVQTLSKVFLRCPARDGGRA